MPRRLQQPAQVVHVGVAAPAPRTSPAAAASSRATRARLRRAFASRCWSLNTSTSRVAQVVVEPRPAVPAAARGAARGVRVHAVDDEATNGISFSRSRSVEVERLVEGRRRGAATSTNPRLASRSSACTRAARSLKPSYMPSKARKNSDRSCRNCRPRTRSASFSAKAPVRVATFRVSRPATK